MECAAVNAGSDRFTVAAFFDVPESERAPTLARHAIDTERIEVPFNCLLIDTAHERVLIDAGIHAEPLVSSLREAGIAPDAVDTVIFTHAHYDHLFGALDVEERRTFPRARYLMSRIEIEQERERAARFGTEVLEDAALPPEIQIVPAPGHTLGQVALKIVSEGETLLHPADVIAHPIHVEHTDWNIISDVDRGQAVRTRAALLEQAAEEGWQVFVYHFPFPGLCRVARDGDGWRIEMSVTFEG